jgi:hypothetical protein
MLFLHSFILYHPRGEIFGMQSSFITVQIYVKHQGRMSRPNLKKKKIFIERLFASRKQSLLC